MMYHNSMLYCAQTTDKGRGVFTDAFIKKDDIVEVCPVTVLSREEVEAVRETIVYEYLFDWSDVRGNEECLPSGFGLIYNHSSEPNIEWDTDFATQSVIFTALRDIEPGEELCHNYWPGQVVVFDEQGRSRARMEAMEAAE